MLTHAFIDQYNKQVSEIAAGFTPERMGTTVIIPEFGKEVPESVFNVRHQKWHTALENGEAPHIHYWDEETVHRVRANQPRILIPAHVDAETATSLEVYQASPFSPFEMSNGDGPGAIIAAGMPSETVLLTDDPNTLSDDAIRSFIKEVHLDDPDLKYLHNRLKKIATERLPENSITSASSALTMFLNLKPQYFIPLFAARMAINSKNILYGPVLDQFGQHIDYLQDSERYARLKHLTKPFLAFTDDSRLHIADIMEEIPEAIGWLKEERGITGAAVCLIDQEHAVAGDRLWHEEKRQKNVLQGTVSRMFDIRRELAHLDNKLLTDNEIADFSDQVTEFLGTVRIFEVLKEPHHMSKGQVEHALPPVHTFVSQRIKHIVQETIEEKVDPGKSEEPDEYYDPNVNNF